ncbi:hypothetical protein DXG03_003647 [Asterophora parasitica]|uniref:Uncharacterized protein n=1 Tax=Asterophora parasitica TaxID=117018 RepID=A0A9P7G1B1_9AGAR|nr:hypothetical protein DXG03_003647 [Asterophora parasitica]
MDSLLLEVSRRPGERSVLTEFRSSSNSFMSITTEKRPVKTNTSWPTFAHYTSDPIASTSSNATVVRTRPLRRTNSSQRARLGPDSASHASSPPAPDGSIWGKDRHELLAVCQNASERMDENAFLHVDMSVDAGTSKRKLRQPPIAGVSKTRRATVPYPVGLEASRWEKGKQKESLVSDANPPNVRRQSLLSSSSSSSSASSTMSSPATPGKSFASPHSMDTSLADFDAGDVSTMDVEPHHEPSEFSGEIARKPAPPSKRPPSREQPASTPPAPRLHPLLTQRYREESPKPAPVRHPAPVTERPPPPAFHSNAPPGLSLSQATRPPALGMRRVHTAPIACQHALPTRQRGFKPPLLSQQGAIRTQASQHTNTKFSRPVAEHPSPGDAVSSGSGRPRIPQPQFPELPRSKPVSSNRSEAHPSKSTPAREPSPEANVDPDSSFGDMSFDMDELEATMQMYD